MAPTHILKTFKITVFVLLLGAATPSLADCPGADEEADTYLSLREYYELDPGKVEKFDEGYAKFAQIAREKGYCHTTYVGGYLNERWVLTSLNNFQDADRLVAKRTVIAEDPRYAEALALIDEATVHHKSFFSQGAIDVGYAPKSGRTWGEFVRLRFYKFAHGQKQEVHAILTDLKAMMVKHDIPFSYEVSYGKFGTSGTSLMISSAGEDVLDFAARDAKVKDLMKNSPAYENLMKRFHRVLDVESIQYTSYLSDLWLP